MKTIIIPLKKKPEEPFIPLRYACSDRTQYRTYGSAHPVKVKIRKGKPYSVDAITNRKVKVYEGKFQRDPVERETFSGRLAGIVVTSRRERGLSTIR